MSTWQRRASALRAWLAETCFFQGRIAVTLLTGGALTLVIWGAVQHRANEEFREEFTREAESRIGAAQREIEADFGVLRLLRGFIESNSEISRDAFEHFSARAMETYPTVRALEWVPRVPGEQRAAFEARLSAHYAKSRQITQGKPGQNLHRAEARMEHYAVEFVHPLVEENDSAIGFDMLQNAATSKAALSAVEGGSIAATGRLRLLEETEDRYGITAFLPVYDQDATGQTSSWRRAHSRGLVMCIFQIGDLLRRGLNRNGKAPIDFTFFDLSNPEGKRFLYGSVRGTPEPASVAELPFSPARHVTRMNVAGRQWIAVSQPAHTFPMGEDSNLATMLLLLGLCGTASATLYVASHCRHSLALAAMNRGLRQEIEIRQHAERELEQLAYHDPLTGLANRRRFADTFDAAVSGDTNRLMAFIYLDLDGFKLINDTLGHGVGDSVLCAVSERLSQLLGPEDLISRTGGDEFNILLRDPESVEDVEDTALKLLKAVETPLHILGHKLSVSASLGVSLYPEDGQDYEQLSSAADDAMYRSKSLGKNRVQRYRSCDTDGLRENRGLVLDLRTAIEQNQLCLFYQPLVNPSDPVNIRFEALIRWQHPEHGLLSPGQFLGLADEAGLTAVLGEWVLNESTRHAKGWQPLTHGFGAGVSVNVSPLQFSRSNFVETIRDTLAASGLDAGLLEIEVTESSLLASFDDARSKFERLRYLGVTVSLDDFGTGYSALSYLPNLPVDTLKIDRSFVTGLERHAGAVSLLESLISLAKKQKLRVVVEGIETVRQMAIVRGMHADELQGYLLGRPMPEPAVRRFLETWHRNRQLTEQARPMLAANPAA